MHRHEGMQAIVVGGSIGGLTSALLLRELGFTVDVTSGHRRNSTIAAAASSCNRSPCGGSTDTARGGSPS